MFFLKKQVSDFKENLLIGYEVRSDHYFDLYNA